MTKFLLIILFPIAAVGLTLIHELGHGVVPLSKGEVVQMSVGGLGGPSFNLGRLTVSSSSLMPPWVGHTSWSGSTDILRLALGPLASLALGLIFVACLLWVPLSRGAFSLFFVCAGWALLQFLLTALPLKYPTWLGFAPGTMSDGRQLIELLLR